MYLFIWKMCRNGTEMKKTHLVSTKEHEFVRDGCDFQVLALVGGGE